MKIDEFIRSFNNIKTRYSEVKEKIDTDKILKRKDELNKDTVLSGFWDDADKAKETLKIISYLDKDIKELHMLQQSFNELNDDIELISLGEELNKDILNRYSSFKSLFQSFETRMMLNGEHDSLGAILTIHPGAGGTESQDWVSMLYRMYIRWCEKNDYGYKIIDYQDGDEAGIKEVTIEIDSPFIYGFLSSESGVHRLVRISPFDSNNRRHTSFAAVFVYPIINNDINIEINDKDIRIDTYRASGAGGQHVNKTDSAVRITHLETGLVVQCQNQRSQLKNKQTAIKLLKSKLFQYQLDAKSTNLKDIVSAKKSIEWGSQIRSYIFHPYNLVKDHRTKYETSNVSDIMDGQIDSFIRHCLLNKMEK